MKTLPVLEGVHKELEEIKKAIEVRGDVLRLDRYTEDVSSDT